MSRCLGWFTWPHAFRPGDDRKPSTVEPGDDRKPSTVEPGDDRKPSTVEPHDGWPWCAVRVRFVTTRREKESLTHTIQAMIESLTHTIQAMMACRVRLAGTAPEALTGRQSRDVISHRRVYRCQRSALTPAKPARASVAQPGTLGCYMSKQIKWIIFPPPPASLSLSLSLSH